MIFKILIGSRGTVTFDSIKGYHPSRFPRHGRLGVTFVCNEFAYQAQPAWTCRTVSSPGEFIAGIECVACVIGEAEPQTPGSWVRSAESCAFASEIRLLYWGG
jgi:hypothetical protein